MDKKTILVIGCHPADVFDHCGGTLAHHVKRGDHVSALVITTGSRVHNEAVFSMLANKSKDERPDSEEFDEILQESLKSKNSEAVEACKILGIEDVRFLGYDDRILLVTEECIEGVARVIRSVKPDIVITHYPLNNAGIASHHGAAGQIVLNATLFANLADFNDTNPPHQVSQVFFMMPEESQFKSTCLSGGTLVYCDYFVDITDVVELKVKAVYKMQSQQYKANFSKKAIEVINGKDGHWMGVGYAEGFVRYYPEIGEYLMVSNERLERANEPEIEKLERGSELIVPFVKL